MWKNVLKTETFHMKARWGKLQNRFLTNFCLSTTRLLINLHEKKVQYRLLFFGEQKNTNQGQIAKDLSQKNFKRQCGNATVFLLAHTSMENGLNVNVLNPKNFQHLQRKTEWFSGGNLTTGKLKTLCLKRYYG